ncbi:MAG: archease [Elusimicrobiales bacterium]|nr:archease [Elusimicrobiales bacterium]
MGSYKINFTGDLEIEVKAVDFKDILDTLVKSFCDIVGCDNSNSVFEKELELDSDIPDIFVDFLNELIYLFETEGFVPKFVSDFKKDEKTAIKLKGFKFDFYKNKPKRILKAATYHDLKFESGDSFYLKIIVDL